MKVPSFTNINNRGVPHYSQARFLILQRFTANITLGRKISNRLDTINFISRRAPHKESDRAQVSYIFNSQFRCASRDKIFLSAVAHLLECLNSEGRGWVAAVVAGRGSDATVSRAATLGLCPSLV